MKVRNVVLLAVAGLVLIEISILYFRKEPIEQALLAQTEQVLDEYGISIVQVSFEGRDATLKGDVASDAEKSSIERIVREVSAIRVIDNQLTVPAGVAADSIAQAPIPGVAPPPSRKAVFRLFPAGEDSLTLAGILPDTSARNLLVDVTRKAFPGRGLRDSLILDTLVARLAWLDALPALVSTLGGIETPVLAADSAGVAVAGTVSSAAQRDSIQAWADRSLDSSLAFNADLQLIDTVDTAAAPNVDINELRGQIEALLAEKRIQFRINTAELVDLSKLVLNDVADLLNEAPDVQVEVEGHTDNIGSVAMNNALSQARADAVRLYLISRGVEASRLTAVGYGPSRPVASNETMEGRIYNRRVVFSLKGGS